MSERPPQPFHELRAGYFAQEQQILAAVRRVLESGHYILGAEVEAFEREFAQWLGVPHVVGVANATDALQLMLLALDVKPGDEVVIPALTAVPTGMAVLAVGATPVLVDVDPATLTMDPAALRGALSPKTRVVLPVHLYGQCADMDALAQTLQQYSRSTPRPPAAAASAGAPAAPVLLEDAAQAHGALDRGRMAGGIGLMGAFSFYPTKNLGTFGDGGAISTRDAALAERLRRLRMYGLVAGYEANEAGINSRLDELHAAILRVRLTTLEAGNAARREHAARYDAALDAALDAAPAALPDGARAARKITRPVERQGARHVYHQYVVRSPRRDALREHLAARGLQTLIHYPRALSGMTVFRQRGRIPAPCTQAERAAAEVLSLPIQPELARRHQDEVIEALLSFKG
ncbi:MAG: DegT/DnrJ/EryC1/StrS family aminotransferase [Planctomycetota bacterium]